MVQAHPIIETSLTTAKLILNVITEKLHKTCPRHYAWRDWVVVVVVVVIYFKASKI